MGRPAVVAVVGPTAAGKTGIGLALAHALGGEIVNADAMALYAGLNIGTAKLPVTQREGVTHHLLDIWPLAMRASVVDYQRLAVDRVSALIAAGVPAVVVGGSGLYVRALLDNLVIPPTDPAIRAELEHELALVGPAGLHERLATVDPNAAAAILPSNGRRLVRALEVVMLTGSFTATLPDGSYRWPATVQIGVDHPDLDARIEARVQEMFDSGLIAEVDQLRGAGLADAPTAAKALGYAQVLADPDNPVAAAMATAHATRRFARRQRSWFRRDRRIQWVSSKQGALAGLAGTAPDVITSD